MREALHIFHKGMVPIRASVTLVCKPDIVYLLDRAHGLHFFTIALHASLEGIMQTTWFEPDEMPWRSA